MLMWHMIRIFIVCN